MYSIEASAYIAKVTDDIIYKLNGINWPTAIPDALLGCTHTISIGCSGLYHGTQWSVRSIPVAIKLTLSQLPIGFIRCIGNSIYEPSRAQTQVHAAQIKKAINSLFHFSMYKSNGGRQFYSKDDNPLVLSKILIKLVSLRSILELGAVSVLTAFMLNGHPTDRGGEWSARIVNITMVGLLSVLGISCYGIFKKNKINELNEQLYVRAVEFETNREILVEQMNSINSENLDLAFKIRYLKQEKSKQKKQLSENDLKLRLNSQLIDHLEKALLYTKQQIIPMDRELQALRNENISLRNSPSQFDPNANLKLSEAQFNLFEAICRNLGLNCPFLKGPFENPVTLGNGQTYSKASITQWFSYGQETDPLTRSPLPDKNSTPNNIITSLLILIQLRSYLILDAKETDAEAVIKQLPTINIEEPVLLVKRLEEEYPVGMTISKADALAVNPNAEVERYIVPNRVLEGYMDQLKAYNKVKEPEINSPKFVTISPSRMEELKMMLEYARTHVSRQKNKKRF